MTEKQIITEKEWFALGTELFGNDVMTWKVVCPACGNIQSAKDFEKYKDRGAIPDTALVNCIGRYMENKRRAFGKNSKNAPKTPCDYTAGGLFNINSLGIKRQDGSISWVFDFDRTAKKGGEQKNGTNISKKVTA